MGGDGMTDSLFVPVSQAAQRVGMTERALRYNITDGIWPFAVDQPPYLVRRVGGRLKVSVPVLEAYARGEIAQAPEEVAS